MQEEKKTEAVEPQSKNSGGNNAPPRCTKCGASCEGQGRALRWAKAGVKAVAYTCLAFAVMAYGAHVGFLVLAASCWLDAF